MPLDASLYNALGVRPKSMMDYQDEYAKQDLQKQAIQQNALALQTGQMGLQEKQRAIQEQTALRNALAGLGAGATDEQRINALRATGLPGGFSQADALEKAMVERRKGNAAAGKDELDQSIKAHEFHVQKLATVQSPQDALAWAQEGLQTGVFTPEQYQRGVQALQQAAQNPQTFAQWKQQALQGGASATEQLKMQAEAVKQQEQARHNRSVEGLTARGQNMADARAREANGVALTKPFEVTGPDGVPMLVQQDKQGNIKPVEGLQPKGMGATKLTEDQGKATGWLSQATNAYANMQAALAHTPSAAKPGINDAIAAVPSFGLGEAIGNSMRGEDRQQYMQSASSLSEALLRAATGAGVNKDEAAQKVRELTPQFGDSDKLVKQKMDAIPVYLESLKVRAGPGAKQLPDIMARAKAATPGQPANDDPLGLRK